MVKKIAALAGAGALVLSLAVPAFAHGWWWGGSRDVAIVNNGATAIADTGGNSQSNVADVEHGGGVTVNGANGDRTMNTGEADAYAGAVVVANTHVGCGPCASGGWNHKDFSMVNNGAVAGAYTGGNGQDDLAFVNHGGGVTVNGGAGARYMNTSSADAESHAWTVVNTHVGFDLF